MKKKLRIFLENLIKQRRCQVKLNKKQLSAVLLKDIKFIYMVILKWNQELVLSAKKCLKKKKCFPARRDTSNVDGADNREMDIFSNFQQNYKTFMINLWRI